MIFFYNFFHIYKCLKLYQLNIINKIKKGYKKKACERYQNLSKEKKEKSGNMAVNLSEDETQKVVEYRKKIL